MSSLPETEGKRLLDMLRTRKSRHGTILAVSMMKDEAPFLLEWFAHHLAVGFTDILVYTNDCTDGTVEMLQRLEELGLGHHRENKIPPGIKPQPSAIKHAQVEPVVGEADWVMLFDADEYLSINHRSGQIDGMLDDAVARGANGIIITWRIFGSGGVVEWSRAPVTEQYLRAAPPLWNKGWGVKTLFKFDPEYWKLGIHRPNIKKKHIESGFADQVHWVNGSGLPMEAYFKFRGWRSIRRTLGYDWAQLNHYAVKSIDSYAVRKFRGNVNNKKDKYNADYWALQDRNEVWDRRILRHAPRRAMVMEALLQDPVLRSLHFTALARVEAKLAEYKQTQAYADLKASLIEASKTPITEVEAKPPKARDPAKIAALMSEVSAAASGETTADEPQEAPPGVPSWAASGSRPFVEQRIDLSEDIAPKWVENQGLMLPIDHRVFTSAALNAIKQGKYERRHARNIPAYIEGHKRFLNIGAGVGFIALKAALDCPGTIVMAQEERDDLIEVARHIAARNGLDDTSRVKFVSGPMQMPKDRANKASGLAAYLSDFRPMAVRFDSMPGDPAALTGILPSTLELILIPWLTEEERSDLSSRYAPVLEAEGFALDEEASNAGCLAFKRG